MLLQEEYLKRHKIALCEVHHTLSSGSLILLTDPDQSDLGSRWVVVSIAWKDNPHHPGEYEVQVCIPVHNSVGPVVFQTVRGYPPNMTMSYEQLEGFFLDFATAHGKLRAVEKHPELALVSWEIFLYTHDKQLTQFVSQNLRTAIETSLDFDLPIDERYYAYIEATNALIVEQPVIFNRYEHFIHIHTKRSLGWLARLVNGV